MKKKLNQYLNLIDKGILKVEDDNLFKEILEKSESILLLSDSKLAVEMQMNRTTVNRWRRGISSPSPIMRKSIYNWLKNRTKMALKVKE